MTERENRIVVDKCELKPCPFCGGRVRFDVSDEISRTFTGECVGCGMRYEYQESVYRNVVEWSEARRWGIGYPLIERINAPFVEVWNNRTNEEVER